MDRTEEVAEGSLRAALVCPHRVLGLIHHPVCSQGQKGIHRESRTFQGFGNPGIAVIGQLIASGGPEEMAVVIEAPAQRHQPSIRGPIEGGGDEIDQPLQPLTTEANLHHITVPKPDAGIFPDGDDMQNTFGGPQNRLEGDAAGDLFHLLKNQHQPSRIHNRLIHP